MTADDQAALPKGWEIGPLIEVAQINPPLGRHILGDHVPVTFVPMRAVGAEGGGLTKPEIRPYGKVKQGYTAFLSGDVITAKITPCMENGKTTVVPEVPGSVCFGSTEFHVIRPEKGIAPKWIERFLLQHKTRRDAQRQMAGGVGQMRVPAEFLNAVRIPVAPSAEQDQIGEVLDELFSDLDAGVAALERARDRLMRYRASVLKAAVEGMLTADWRAAHPDVEPASELLKRILAERRKRWAKDRLRKFAKKGKEPPTNWRSKYKEPAAPHTSTLPLLPDWWCWATVDQCSSLIQYGSSSKTGCNSSGIPVLRMGNITAHGRLILEDLKYLPLDHDEFPELLLEKGDLIFNRTNSVELVGKTAEYSGDPSPCSFASYLIRVRLLQGIASTIVLSALNGGIGKTWIRRVVNQTVGQANVNGSKLASFVFSLPPVAEQDAIVEAVEDQLSIVDHLEANLNAKMAAAEGLRQAFLRSAFSGRLMPQNPNDKPASELLKCIAAEREARRRNAAAAKRAARRTGDDTHRRRRLRTTKAKKTI